MGTVPFRDRYPWVVVPLNIFPLKSFLQHLSQVQKERQAGLEEKRRRQEAEAAIVRAELRREQGVTYVQQRTLTDKAAASALAKQCADTREKALAVVHQLAWSYLFAAARGGDATSVRKLLDPPLLPPILPGRAGGKHRAATARIEVDLRGNEWAAEELGGGGGNPRGSWFTEAVDVNAAGGSMRRTALHGACANGHLDVVKV